MILVLDAETSSEELERVASRVRALGWIPHASRGPEQVVLALEGAGDAAALERALRGLEVDVIPILSAREYRLRRWRRKLLTGLASGLGLLTAAGAGLPLVGFLLPPRTTFADAETVPAGSAERLAVGAARTVSFHGHPVLVIRLEPERHVALSAICTHMSACKLGWDPSRRLLVCGCHGCAFDIHGNVVRPPASTPLSSYTVESIGDELFVRRS